MTRTGSGASPTPSPSLLERFTNPHPERDYLIRIRIPEFTCLCPRTGQPDFATLLLEYIPGDACIELKSLKQYVWSYRNEGAFHEAVTNRILGDLVTLLVPRFMRLTARFNVRGGIYTTVVAEHRQAGWAPSEQIPHLRPLFPP
jgi:7-cyano-7-deazaguanine reductase